MDEGQIRSLADELSGKVVITSANDTVASAQIAQQAGRWREDDTQKERTRINPIVWPLAIALAALMAWELGTWIATSRRLL